MPGKHQVRNVSSCLRRRLPLKLRDCRRLQEKLYEVCDTDHAGKTADYRQNNHPKVQPVRRVRVRDLIQIMKLPLQLIGLFVNVQRFAQQPIVVDALLLRRDFQEHQLILERDMPLLQLCNLPDLPPSDAPIRVELRGQLPRLPRQRDNRSSLRQNQREPLLSLY